MKFKLQIKDIVDLYNFYKKYPEGPKYPNTAPSEQLRYNRARGLDLIDSQGILSEFKGKRVLRNFEKKIKLYKEGVPWDDYLKKHEKQCLSMHTILPLINHNGWARVPLPVNLVYIFDGAAIIAGDHIQRKGKNTMKIVSKDNLGSNLDIFIKKELNKYGDMGFPIAPHTFCWDILKQRELLWFADMSQGVWIPIQAPYIKFIFARFSYKKIKFYALDTALELKENPIVVIASPTKKIRMYRRIAACIKPLENIGDFHVPDRIDAVWGEKFTNGKREMV